MKERKYPGWERVRIHSFFHKKLRILMLELERQNYPQTLVRELDWVLQVLGSFLSWWNAPGKYNPVDPSEVNWSPNQHHQMMAETDSKWGLEVLALIEELLEEMKMDWTLIGIPNCDKIKKAKKVLENCNVEYQFRDYREAAPTLEELVEWEQHLGGLDAMINKRSTSYRELGLKEKKLSLDELRNEVLKTPTLLQRPILLSSRGSANSLPGMEKLLEGRQ